MDTHDILDENTGDEQLLTLYARKKARHAGFWMIITSAAGLLLFGSFGVFSIYIEGGEVDDTEEIVLLLFFISMTFKYAILLTSAIQTRQGALAGRWQLLHKSAFNARIAWVFVGILALLFMLQVILYWATGFEMFGDITRELLHVNWRP